MSYIGKKPVDFNDVTESQTFTVTGDLTVDTNTLYVDSTNNRVGIGTAPSVNLHIKDTGNNTQIRVENNDGIAKFQKFEDDLIVTNTDTGNILIKTGTGETTALTIDASQNVGIGTSSPSSILHLSASNDPIITLTDTGFGASADITGSNGNLRLNSQTATIFDMADSEVMRIDSSGNVGIGTSSPACGLHVDNPDNGAITAILDTDNSAVKMVFRNNTETGNNVQIGADGSNLVALTGASERMRILSDGKVLVTRDPTNTSTNSMSIEFVTSAPSSSKVRHINFVNSGQGRGYIRSGDSDSDLPSFVAGSDYRFKTNITDYTGGYDKIKSIPVKQFDETISGKTGCVGWIAHEVSAVFPDAVVGTKDAVDDDGNPIYQGLAPSAFYADVVQALQQAIAKIETLEAKVTALENT